MKKFIFSVFCFGMSSRIFQGGKCGTFSGLANFVLPLILIFTFIGEIASAKFVLRNCSPKIANNIRDVLRSSSQDLNDVFMGEFNFVSAGLRLRGSEVYRPILYSFPMNIEQSYQKKIREFLFLNDKEHTVVINCKPKGFICRKGVSAYVLHPLLRGKNKTIYLCNPTEWYTFLNCELKKEIFHELAHLAELPIASYHNKSSHPNFENRFIDDSVYQFGTAMENSCFEKVLTHINSTDW